MAKQAKKVPVSAVLFGVLGLAAVARAAWRPFRALTKEAKLTSCAGPGGFGVCADTLELAVPPGSAILAAGGGRVASVGPNWVHINVATEDVITAYYDLSPTVSVGDYVWPGSKIGRSDGKLRFGVTHFTPRPETSGATLTAVEPASWLAGRGYRIAQNLEGGADLWCAAGRNIKVPANVHGQCKLEMPMSPGFALLPTSIEQA